MYIVTEMHLEAYLACAHTSLIVQETSQSDKNELLFLACAVLRSERFDADCNANYKSDPGVCSATEVRSSESSKCRDRRVLKMILRKSTEDPINALKTDGKFEPSRQFESSSNRAGNSNRTGRPVRSTAVRIGQADDSLIRVFAR